MSVAEMQACLARLYTQESYRRLYYLDPDTPARDYALTELEANALDNLDRAMLERHAAGLKLKRARRLRASYPLLFRLYAPYMGRYLDRYIQLYPARPHEPVQDQVVAFGSFVEESMAGEDAVPPYASDISRYERLCYLARACPRTSDVTGVVRPQGQVQPPAVVPEARPYLAAGVQLADFRYDVPRASRFLARKLVPLTLRESGNYCYVFQHVAYNAPPKLHAVSAGAGNLLRLCSGNQTVSAIATAIGEATGRQGVLEDIGGLVDKFIAMGILQVRQYDESA